MIWWFGSPGGRGLQNFPGQAWQQVVQNLTPCNECSVGRTVLSSVGCRTGYKLLHRCS